MVAILPPKTNPGNLIGQALGQGLNQGMQQRVQRGLIQKALGQLKGLEKEKNVSPYKAASSVIGALAGVPGGDRIAAALLPPLLQQTQVNQRSAPETVSALADVEKRLPGFLQQDNQNTQGGFAQSQISSQQTQSQAIPNNEDLLLGAASRLGESYFPNIAPPTQGDITYKPQTALKPPPPIGPKATAEIRQYLKESGVVDKGSQDELIQEIKNYQTENYNAQKEGFANFEAQQKAQQNEDVRFNESISQQLDALHPNMPPEKLNIWRGISRLAENQGTDEARFRQTEQMYDNLVENPLRSFNENVQDLPYASIIRPGLVQERLDNARSLVQDHLKEIDKIDAPNELKSEIKNNLRDSYFTSLVSKDYGTAQASGAIYNLSNGVKSSIPMAPKPTETGFESVPFGGKSEIRSKYVDKLAESLFENLKEDDSLVLAREKAIQNNYDEASFNASLRQAIGRGLKLSTFQKNERPKLDLPYRLDLDSIMGGKRSVFDFVKRKQ